MNLPGPGTVWENRWTGEHDTVLRVGPCANLDGATRIWLKRIEEEWPSNGWDPEYFARCWVPAPGEREEDNQT